MEPEIIYRARAYRAGPLASFEPRLHAQPVPYLGVAAALQHASWLCLQVPALVGAGDETKARRYLAMAEALMFAHGVCNWADIESLNDNPERVG